MRVVTGAAVGRLVGGFGSATLFLWFCYPRPPRDQQFIGLMFIAAAGLVGIAGAAIGGRVGGRLGR